MADISIQFHVLPDELLAFVKSIVSDFSLHVVAMRFFPFDATEINSDGLDEIFSKNSPCHQLGFTLNEPILAATGAMDFLDKNPGALRITIERQNKEGLRQSLLSARTNDPTISSVWKKIAKRLNEFTQTGVVVTSPDTGASTQNRSHRYSVGAKTLAASGVPMLPIAGENRIEFSELRAETKIQK